MLGLCVAIKPHFALCALMVSGFEAFRSRDIRTFFRIEHWAAGAVALAYFVASVVFYPRYFSDILPMLADLYLPIRLGLVELVKRAALAAVLPVSLCWLFRHRAQNAGTIALLMIGAGFLCAYLIQGKGWNYHAYPFIAFFLIAASWAIQQSQSEAAGLTRKLGLVVLAITLISFAPRFFRADVSHPGLAEAITRWAPHPEYWRSLSPKISASAHARHCGVWVGRTWGLWATGGAALMRSASATIPFCAPRRTLISKMIG